MKGLNKPMIRVTILVAAVLAASPDLPEGQGSQHLGCYDLHMGRWTPAVSLRADSFYIAPPPRIQLTDSAVGSPQADPKRFAVVPAPGSLPSIHEYTYWSATSPDSVRMVWTNGFSGVGAQLQTTAIGFEGTAQSFWDFQRERQEAPVTAQRVSCNAPVPVDLSDRTRTLRGLIVGSGDSLLLDQPLPAAMPGIRVSTHTVRLTVDPGEILAGARTIDVNLDSTGIVRAIVVSYDSANYYPALVKRLTTIWGAPLGVESGTTRTGAVRNVASWHDRLTIKWAWGIAYPDGREETRISMGSRRLPRARPPNR